VLTIRVFSAGLEEGTSEKEPGPGRFGRIHGRLRGFYLFGVIACFPREASV